jgi:hypothetical protein
MSKELEKYFKREEIENHKIVQRFLSNASMRKKRDLTRIRKWSPRRKKHA